MIATVVIVVFASFLTAVHEIVFDVFISITKK